MHDHLTRILDWPGIKWLFLVLALVMPLASLLTWAERRQSAMMQDRLGPNRANIGPIKLKGILHFVADALEDDLQGGLHPGERPQGPVRARADPRARAGVDRVRDHPVRPDDLSARSHGTTLDTDRSSRRDPNDAGVRGLDPHADLPGRLRPDLLLRGAHARELRRHDRRLGQLQQVGAARRPAQLVADDVVRGRDGPVAHGRVPRRSARSSPARSSRARRRRATMSASNPLNWLWLWQPVGLVLFFTAAIAETKRAPFDIPEGEPEIIGYFVEYSGMRWGMFFLAEFIEIVFISAVIATVFFGGWQVPFLDADGFRIGGYIDPVGHARSAARAAAAARRRRAAAVRRVRRQGDPAVLVPAADPLDAAALPRRSADEPRLEAAAAARRSRTSW